MKIGRIVHLVILVPMFVWFLFGIDERPELLFVLPLILCAIAWHAHLLGVPLGDDEKALMVGGTDLGMTFENGGGDGGGGE